MPTTLSHSDGRLTINEIASGRFLITAEPSDRSKYIAIRSLETSYPIELIEKIFGIKGPSWVCDEIARDEDPNYVSQYLINEVLAYFEPAILERVRILDFGCGSGASTAILARQFPGSQIVGVELSDELLSIAKARADLYNLKNVQFFRSPSGMELPDGLGEFDLAIMSAVYEHLLPEERPAIMKNVWKLVKKGGYLFMNQTPNRLFPIELHTTLLPFINYLPDRLAHWYARNFSKRIGRNETWESLLREGIRGATVSEISKRLSNGETSAEILPPLLDRDRIDLWFESTNPEHLRSVKLVAKHGLKLFNRLTGICLVPDLSLAFRKK